MEARRKLRFGMDIRAIRIKEKSNPGSLAQSRWLASVSKIGKQIDK